MIMTINYHIKDTVKNGHELCDVNAVENIIKQGKQSIDLLARTELSLIKKDKYLIKLLKAVIKRRIIYHNDNTGEEIYISDENNYEFRKYHLKENFMAIDLIGKKDSMCEGLYALDNDEKDVITIKSHITILASVGA